MAFCLSGQVGAQITNRFDQDAEGWIMADLPFPTGPYTTALTNYPTTYSAMNGNPGGHIWQLDPMSSRVYYFQAPALYLGNRSNYYGGTLTFDVRRQNGSLLNYTDVVLVGGGFTFVIDAGSGPANGVWTTYTVRLNETGGWKKDLLTGVAPSAEEFALLLGNLSALRIRGEYSTSSVDTGALDNVILSPPPPLAVSIARLPANEVQFCWNSETGKLYQVQYRPDLNAGSWTNTGSLLPGNGSNYCTAIGVTNIAEKYFRVVQQP
ncbi:MAG TPA: laminin B domain-containing protein [Verrucomicrobiae bacterium]|jgi:hypothetical protein